eukprot:scaffold1875_cov339-Prasinococcus_capsulatus_cf.AAC.2
MVAEGRSSGPWSSNNGYKITATAAAARAAGARTAHLRHAGHVLGAGTVATALQPLRRRI